MIKKDLKIRYKGICEEYKTIKKDVDRFLFVKKYKGDLKLVLDNDVTKICFTEKYNIFEYENKDFEMEYFVLDDYLGNKDLILVLLEMIGIDAELC